MISQVVESTLMEGQDPGETRWNKTTEEAVLEVNLMTIELSLCSSRKAGPCAEGGFARNGSIDGK